MPRDMERGTKDSRTRGASQNRRDAPSREIVDTSSVRHTLSRQRDINHQSEQQSDGPIYGEKPVGGGDAPPLRRQREPGAVPSERGASSLRFDRDSGLRQPDENMRKKPLRTGRAEGPKEFTAPPREDGDPAAEGAMRQRQPRLQFTKEETPPERSRDVVSDKANAARRRADKADAQLVRARDNLPKTHRPHVEKSFDEHKGKVKKRLIFEDEVKSRRAHLQGSPLVRPVNAAKNAAIGYGHKKIHEVEHENVGTEAAHKTELLAEGGVRMAYRRHKTAPYRRVTRLEKKAPRLRMQADYKQAVAENPKLKSNIISRMAQKRKIKREYARLAREARKTGNA